MYEIGVLEYTVYQAECAVLRLRRSAELIQAKINRKEAVDLEAIEQQLDEEFREYQEKLDEQIEAMRRALDRNEMIPLSNKEVTEIKKLYRSIAMKLHPDIYPELSDEHLDLFRSATRAYKNCDIASLRIIDVLIDASPATNKQFEHPLDFENEVKRLNEMISMVRKDIEAIKSSYPYTMKQLLSDPVQVEQKKRELDERIEELQHLRSSYEDRITETSKE
jgi:seryl-tRNA synthetase